uniref:Uncharacterized protein n=1 Tax=Glossina austeni TaxID=7395 RepID=A0A1A9UDB0_GLOAU
MPSEQMLANAQPALTLIATYWKCNDNKISLKISGNMVLNHPQSSGQCQHFTYVDVSPVLYQESVTVGSHFYLLVVLNAIDGKEISKSTLMERTESPVLFITNELAAYYYCFLYAFDFQQGELILQDC